MMRYMHESCASFDHRMHNSCTFSSLVSRSFLLKLSMQSLKHRSTSELYIRKLHRHHWFSAPGSSCYGSARSGRSVSEGDGCRAVGPVSDLHLFYSLQQLILLLVR